MIKMKFDIKEKIRRYVRVLRITRKPSRFEFSGAAKITGIGLIIIGGIGFILFLIGSYTGIFG